MQSAVEHAPADLAGSGGVTLRFTFPGRRYHATPWGHHVNEGVVEWPPSPWRLLRSFLATGYAKLHWPGEGPPPIARSLVEKLAAELPHYRLPDAIGTHSRHYMPMARFKNGREETTMVLDTWAQIDEGAIEVHWNVELTLPEQELLGRLVAELGYLGRSESWVEGTLVQGGDETRFDVRPEGARERPGFGWEQVSLLAAQPPGEYAVWREREVGAALERIPEVNAKGKPLSKAQKSKLQREARATYPPDLIQCLQVDTAWLQDLGWNQPPGSRKVFYWRPSGALESSAPPSRRRATSPAPIEFMLLSMASASGNMHALPSTTRTLPQGELLHRALLSHCSQGQTPPAVLSGRDAAGNPLRNGHAHLHAHLLHLDLDQDGYLDHALVWAPMGLDARAQQVVRAVRRTFSKGASEPLRLALEAAGSRSDLSLLPAPLGDRFRRIVGGMPTGARSWRSVTPFVPARFLKPRGRNTLEGQIASELETRGFPAPAAIRILDPRTDDAVGRSRHFVRRRRKGQLPPPVDIGFMLELELCEPAVGPLVLGYGSHFGLGLFSASARAADEQARSA